MLEQRRDGRMTRMAIPKHRLDRPLQIGSGVTAVNVEPSALLATSALNL